MNLLNIFALFCLRIAAVSCVLAVASPYLLPRNTPRWILNYRFIVSFAICFTGFVFDAVYIWPFYRSPLRHLPVAQGRDNGDIVTESPRGKTILEWIRNAPDAELILAYGPANTPTLICAGPNALRDVLNTNTYEFEKAWGLRAFLARIIGWGLIISEGDEHKRQKRILTPAFHIRRIRQLYGLMWNKSNILCEQIEDEIQQKADSGATAVVEIGEWASRLTLDIIGPTAMGRDFESMQNPNNMIAKSFLELLDPKIDRMIFLGLHWLIPEWILRQVPHRINRDINRICGYLRQTCSELVKSKQQEMREKKANGVHPESNPQGDSLSSQDTDILSHIMEAGDFSDSELVDQMLTFLAAGHETTSNSILWACYLCAKYPTIQSKLREEVRSRISSRSSSITWDLLESMPYLNGVCEETLRLFPTVPLTVRESFQDTVVAGTRIPAGEELLIVPYAINRHPRLWGGKYDPNDIVPERWIDTAEDGSQRPNKTGGASTNFASLTFLHGPRACIGRDFAKAELRCAVAALIGSFEMSLTTDVEPRIIGVVTTKAEGGMYLNMKKIEGW